MIENIIHEIERASEKQLFLCVTKNSIQEQKVKINKIYYAIKILIHATKY